MRFFTFLFLLLISPILANASQSEDAQAAFGRHDYQTALKILRLLADKGNADAEYQIGNMYLLGLGIKRDRDEANSWYAKAASHGDERAKRIMDSLQKYNEEKKTFVLRAIFYHNSLWLLSDSGDLYQIPQTGSEAKKVSVPSPRLDMWKQSGGPGIITCDSKECKRWSILHWKKGGWWEETRIETDGDRLLGVAADENGVVILTNKRIVNLNSAKIEVVNIYGKLGPGIITAIHPAQDSLLVSTNAGEWGGGLWRVNRKSGQVNKVTGDFLGSDMPVNAIVDEPGKTGCLVVATGLVHMEAHGAIIEMCGNKMRQLYSKRYDKFSTVAFFGLANDHSVTWAAGMDGLYKIDFKGDGAFSPLPEFRNVGGFNVSFGMADLALVQTRINQRHSVSGRTPMIVSKQ
jgi:hypothetical protein